MFSSQATEHLVLVTCDISKPDVPDLFWLQGTTEVFIGRGHLGSLPCQRGFLWMAKSGRLLMGFSVPESLSGASRCVHRLRREGSAASSPHVLFLILWYEEQEGAEFVTAATDLA